MSLSFRTSQTPSSAVVQAGSIPTIPIALNFYSALHLPGLRVYTYGELGLLGSHFQVAGVGGQASVEVGIEDTGEQRRLVAVKRSRQPECGADDALFGKHLNHLTLELRILADRRLRKHPNIINVFGLCMDEFNGSPSLALVLEYSDLGSLKAFLGREQGLPCSQHIELIQQVAEGLAALHSLQVCHGDVKTQNVIVFAGQSENSWLAKISDFGMSVVPLNQEPSEIVECPFGTRLLNAPEVRGCKASGAQHMTLADALLTDIFSFGLLAWEVLKGGDSYFENSWISRNQTLLDLDMMEDFVNRLPHNELKALGLDFVRNSHLNDTRRVFELLFEYTLQDTPQHRAGMSTICEALQEHCCALGPRIPSSVPFPGDFDYVTDVFDGSWAVWTKQNSLFELLDHQILFGSQTFESIPLDTRKRMLSELKAIATTENLPTDERAHAAMTISECYSVGFFGMYDIEQVVHWLHMASSLGLKKAAMCYPRIGFAFGASPTWDAHTTVSRVAEDRIVTQSTQQYLISRIHYFNKANLQRIEESSVALFQHSSLAPIRMEASIFNDSMVDDIQLLHLAAWLGKDSLLKQLLQIHPLEMKSTQGFNALHYACFGGQTSTLRLLISAGVPMTAAGFHGVTPLHLSIFFPAEDVSEVVDLLVDRGAKPEAASEGTIKWEDHDILLKGTTLEWAVHTRYSALVQCLTPHYVRPDYRCINLAIGTWFWDILENLLPHARGDPNLVSMLTYIRWECRPFFNWIAHGAERLEAVQKTVRICKNYDLIGYSIEGQTHLIEVLTAARTPEDLHMAESIIQVSSDDYVKSATPDTSGACALHSALHRSQQNESWSSTVKALAGFYTIKELQDYTGPLGSFLHTAVVDGSVVGARVLLERGVDVNAIMTATATLPIEACIFNSKSTDMLSMLLSRGADLLLCQPTFGHSAPERILSSGRNQRVLLDALVQHDYDDMVYIEALRGALESAAILRERVQSPMSDHTEMFLRLLMYERFSRHVDWVAEDRTTLIQRAACWLHADSVRALLDAGADASIPFHWGQHDAVPLQLACAFAREVHMKLFRHPTEVGSFDRQRGSEAMAVAVELLRWHHARGDTMFRGISELHLACLMAIPSEFERLIQAGHDPNARGTWPAVPGEVTPALLLQTPLKLDLAVAAHFPFPSEANGMIGRFEKTETSTLLAEEDGPKMPCALEP